MSNDLDLDALLGEWGEVNLRRGMAEAGGLLPMHRDQAYADFEKVRLKIIEVRRLRSTLPARPAAGIEKLVDHLIAVADEEGFARARGIAHLPTWPARTALLAALATPAPVPADLAALLTECAGAGWPWLVDGPNGDAYRRHHRSGERAIASFRFARAEVARIEAAARRAWFLELGFTLAMIGLAAACDESDAAYEARTGKAAA